MTAAPETTTTVPFLDVRALNASIAVELSAAVSEVTGHCDFIGGSAITAFETEWARYCGVEHAVGVANGTDALELGLLALGIGAGDEVIVPANTFIATAEAVSRTRATPVFVDVDPGTLLITTDAIRSAITPRTAAVAVVHLYGQMPDMDAIGRLASHYGIAVVEDAAQAHGATWLGQRAGSFGAVGCFSFFPGKNLGAWGDAGAVVTNNGAVANRVRTAANHGRGAGEKYVHSEIGRNSRLDTIQAAVLSTKLSVLDAWNDSRRALDGRYRRLLDGSAVQLVTEAAGAHSVHHLNVALVPDRDELRLRLAQRGIQTGIHYPVPCHLQPAYASGAVPPRLPVTEAAALRLLSLPLTPNMDVRDVDRVCEVLTDLTSNEVPR